MTFEGIPNFWLYILMGVFTTSSILLFFLSKHIIRQEKVNDSYEEERKTCKFKYLSKKDRLTFLMVVQKIKTQERKFKLYKDERKLLFKNTDDAIATYSTMQKNREWMKKYKIDVHSSNEHFYIDFLE